MMVSVVRTSGRGLLARAGLLAAALAVGCAPEVEQPDCSALEEVGGSGTGIAPGRPAPSAKTARSAADLAPPVLPAVPGEPTPKVLVTVANASDERVLALDALQGSLDEPLVLLASAPSIYGPEAAAGGAKEHVQVAVSAAYALGDEAVPLRLVDPATGLDVTSIDVAVGDHVFLRLAGEGFARVATYRASLTLFGATPAVYRLRIKSETPHRPLGLRATKWASTFANAPIVGRMSPVLVLPADTPAPELGRYHVTVRPADAAPDDAKPLPACGIVARSIPGRDDKVLVVLPPLEPGRYAGTLEIQGEPLAVDITIKTPFWFVWVLVAIGAALSLGVREIVRYRVARESAERNIVDKERALDRKSEGMLRWDELVVRNLLRLARGRKSYLALDDVEGILQDAVPRERAELAVIESALNDTALPAPLRAELRARFERLGYLCSREDARAVDRGLADLAREAQDGFQSALQRWLADLKEVVSAADERIVDLLQNEEIRRDAKGVVRVLAALRMLGALVEDARALALDCGLSVGQADVLSKVGRALATIEQWAKERHIPEGIVAIIHTDFRELPPAPAKPEVAALPKHLTIRARGPLEANAEITFELMGAADDRSEPTPFEPTPLPVEWWIDERLVMRGGPRLTYVFERAWLRGLRRRRVEVKIGGARIADWYERIDIPAYSVAVYERAWSLGARTTATIVGVILTGAAAVGLLWANKAFGGWSDYIAAVLTGLGADLTVVAGGGKLLDTVLGSLFSRRRGEEDR